MVSATTNTVGQMATMLAQIPNVALTKMSCAISLPKRMSHNGCWIYALRACHFSRRSRCHLGDQTFPESSSTPSNTLFAQPRSRLQLGMIFLKRSKTLTIVWESQKQKNSAWFLASQRNTNLRLFITQSAKILKRKASFSLIPIAV